MTQVLDEFEQLLEESFAKSNSVADIVEGTVIKKESEGYLVSVKGAKMEAFLSNKELSSDIEELEIGEVREFYVLKEENNEDSMLLSLKRIAFAQAWAQLNDAKIQGDTILAKVVSTVKGGVLVDVADLKGFIPSSQLRTGTPFEGLVDTKIEVKVLEADPKKNKLILSQRQAVAEQRDQVVDNVLSSLEEDQIVSGNVVRITDFGAFVDINGIDGLLPISEISWQRIKHPSDVLTLGDTIEVKIIKIDEFEYEIDVGAGEISSPIELVDANGDELVRTGIHIPAFDNTNCFEQSGNLMVAVANEPSDWKDTYSNYYQVFEDEHFTGDGTATSFTFQNSEPESITAVTVDDGTGEHIQSSWTYDIETKTLTLASAPAAMAAKKASFEPAGANNSIFFIQITTKLLIILLDLKYCLSIYKT